MKTEHVPLVAQWKSTSKKDHRELSRICVEMLEIFNRAFPKTPRSSWQKRHSASYNYAVGNGIIPRVMGIEARLSIERKTSDVDIALTARARDALHDFCMMSRIPYEGEQAGGEVLKQQIQAGNGYNSALEMAKRVAKDGL